jgi:hypothetical protein
MSGSFAARGNKGEKSNYLLLAMRCMDYDRSPSRSGQRTKCHWFGSQQ